MKNMLVIAAVLWSGLVRADLLTLDPGGTEKFGVNISTGASVTGTPDKLTTVGSGLRKKKVLIATIKVYVAQLLVSDAGRYVKTADGALASLDHDKTVAMHLTFLRDVPATNIKESFQVSLDANGVPADDADIVKFMSLVDEVGSAESGGSLTILISKNADGTESLALENKGSSSVDKSMIGAKGLTHKLMSIWLGNPADDMLADLKAELLQ